MYFDVPSVAPFTLIALLYVAGAADVWNYNMNEVACPEECTVADKCGLECWSKVNPLCKEGTRQSPINVSSALPVTIPFQQRYLHANASLGCSTWEQGPNGASYNGYEYRFMPYCDNLRIKSSLASFLNPNADEVEEEYVLNQMHIHFPAEHAIGASSNNVNDAELHLVHKSANSNVLVIGIRFILNNNADLIDLLSSPNNRPVQPLNDRPLYFVNNGPEQKSSQSEVLQMITTLNEVFDSLSSPSETIQVTTNSRTINPYVLLRSALPTNDFYVYEGSFTTPPCSEGVTWLFYDSPIKVESVALTSLFKSMLQGISGGKLIQSRDGKNKKKTKPTPNPTKSRKGKEEPEVRRKRNRQRRL